MPKETLEELVENFSLFEDWEERYRYLIDLGRSLPAMDDALKTDETFVQGCTSRVWIQPEIREGRFYFVADSDAHIVRGLIAILDRAYQGVELTALKDVDIAGAFEKIGLDQKHARRIVERGQNQRRHRMLAGQSPISRVLALQHQFFKT